MYGGLHAKGEKGAAGLAVIMAEPAHIDDTQMTMSASVMRKILKVFFFSKT